MKGIIYRAISPSNKKYIGQTTQDLDVRIQQHNNRSRKYNFHFYIAIRKYEIENFDWEILESYEFKSIERLKNKLENREKYWIEKEGSFLNGYNMTLGGRSVLGLKRTFSTEHKRKLSKSHTGKKLSDIHKKHIGESGKGRIVTAETRKKMSDLQKNGKGWMNGNIPSEETKNKLSEASKSVKKIKCLYCGNEFAPWTIKRHTNNCKNIN